MDALLFIHQRLAGTVVLFTTLGAVWGLVLYARGRGVDGTFWGILYIAEIVYIVQAASGVLRGLGGAVPSEGIHWLYGIVTIVALPGYLAISRGRDDRIAARNYGLLLLFLAAMTATRTIPTG